MSFLLDTSQGTMHTRFLVWAAGEFQYPNLTPFPGGELCIHNSTVQDWATNDPLNQITNGNDFIIIGGYESGIDAAIHLVQQGKRVRVLDDYAPWAFVGTDPSLVLSPYTLNRLRVAMESNRLELMKTGVVSVEAVNGHQGDEQGVEQGFEQGFVIHTTDDQILQTATPPILATGFTNSLTLVEDLLERHPDGGYPWLTQEADESRKTPGLFLSGPYVRHGNLIFCFVYKFRQRFAVIANEIGQRLGVDTSVLDGYRHYHMFLDDLDCCDDDCVC